MVRVREIPRTAAFAWSPGTLLPFLVTGTRAGAVDAEFSSNTQLELWNLDLNNPQQQMELQPACSIATDSRFYDLAWAQPNDGLRKGVIAGALENGSLDLWDADKLLIGEGEGFISRTSKHTGAIKTLQFNPFRSELLATAGARGELFISDLNNVSNPFRLGNTVARSDDFECLDWNKKVPHILVTGSGGGFVTVWDMKAKKESLTLNNLGRKPVSAVVWDPEKPTRLITAVPVDTDPLILVWDLRNSNAPERILRGHAGGVLSLSWCRQDSDLLLSCGKDNRTLCWNPQGGELYGEFPVVTNWTFQTKWNPQNPNLVATASFDGKVAVRTLQNIKGDIQSVRTHDQTLDGEEFFNQAQSQPQGASFTLPKAPRWLEKPCGAMFGFGGKIVSFTYVEAAGNESPSSAIRISSFAVDSAFGALTENFEKALHEKNFSIICNSHLAQADIGAEKTDWMVIKSLVAKSPRKELTNQLGISNGKDNEATDEVSKLSLSGTGGQRLLAEEGNNVLPAKSNRLSAFFGSNNEGDGFTLDLTATKGAKTYNPFQIYVDSDNESDKMITRALLLGQFDQAMEVCLREDRISDAFMIATCGGEALIDKVQKAYLLKQASGPKYLRLLASVVGKNLWDIVYNADLGNWREVMVILCTFASNAEFSDLCEALGDRLDERVHDNQKESGIRNDASFCYIAGSKLEKVVHLWITELEYSDSLGAQSLDNDYSFTVHARALQSFIEKVTVFRELTQYDDTELTASGNWKLAPLYDKYMEYADIVATHGQLQIAARYLDLLPDKYPTAVLARDRVKQATENVSEQSATKQPVASQIPTPNVPIAPSRLQNPEDQPALQSNPSVQSFHPYAASSIAQVQNTFSLQGGTYGESSYSVVTQPRVQFGVPAQTPFDTQTQISAIGPPRNVTTSPSAPPPSKAQSMANWNDTPDSFFKPPISRRGTPAAQQPVVNAPFPNQPVIATPPVAGQSFVSQRQALVATTPPRGSVHPPLKTMISHVGGSQDHQQTTRPLSSAASNYAPQQSINASSFNTTHPQIPRGPSPYNAQPAVPPPLNRYAPSSAPQQTTSTSQTRRPSPPPNPRSAQQNFSTQQNPARPKSVQDSNNPNYQQTHGSDRGRQPPNEMLTRSKTPKYPPGDRSHITANVRPIYEILSEDMQRVKAKAPSSFAAQVNDTEKRLNILFDHLNNEDLLKPNTIQDMAELANCIRMRNYEKAQVIHVDILTNRTDECGQWMVGVKRLISMSKATP